MKLDTLIGFQYTEPKDPTIKYTCVGYLQNNTQCVFGAVNDVPNNRFKVFSHKITEVTFIGQIDPTQTKP